MIIRTIKQFTVYMFCCCSFFSCNSIQLLNVPVTQIDGFEGGQYSNNITYKSDQIFKSRHMIEFLNMLKDGTYQDLDRAGYSEKEATKKGGLMSPLSWALYAKNKSTFKWLIEHNANVFDQFTYIQVPVIMVVNQMPDPEYLEIILQNGLNIEYTDHHGNNLLLNAMYQGTEQTAKIWIKYSDNLFKKNRIGKNAFTLACSSAKYKIAGLLLDIGMDPFPENDHTNNVCLTNLYFTRGFTDSEKWDEYFTFYERLLTIQYEQRQERKKRTDDKSIKNMGDENE